VNITPGSSALSTLEYLKSRLGSQPPRLLVVGDVMLDRYVRGQANRLSPEAPAPVIDVNDESCFPGGAANVMNNLAALGVQVVGLSVVGDDACGRQLRDILQHSGVDVSHFVIEPERQTPEKMRVHTDTRQVIRIDRETTDALSPTLESELLGRVDMSAGAFDAVVLCDYAKGVLTPRVLQEIIRQTRERDIPVLIDPKGIDATRYHGATLISPNRDEAERLAGFETHTEETLDLAGRTLVEQTQAQHVVITLADDGMAAYGNSQLRLPATVCEVHDVSGAGDTFLSVMAVGFACGIPFEIAAELSSAAAAVAVSRYGTATVTLQDIEATLAGSHLSQSADGSEVGTIPFPGLARVSSSASNPPVPVPSPVNGPEVEPTDRLQAKTIDEIEVVGHMARSEGQAVVFTNGCFDLLHPGHVEYLVESRRCGDLLIVGLNSDASVRRLKGHGRPVHSERDRVRMLLALRCVDYVVIFEEDTPTSVIRRLKPDVLTKGGDYTVSQVVGAELVDDVRLIPFVPGQSTTATIDRIREAG